MQIETFKIFCDLVETGSFSKAASLNSITQSAVSQQIRSLENRFKVILIERGRRNFSLTPEGEAFLNVSKEILDIYDNLGNRLHELQNVVAGELTVATIYSIGLHELPPLLKSYRKKFTDVEVKVEYRRSSEVYSMVLNGEADIGLVSYPTKRKGLLIEPFLKDRLVLICHPDHKFAGRKEIRIEELEGEKFIAFEPDLPTRKVIDRHLRDRNVTINQTMEFDNIETVKRVVEIENGISIVPQNTVDLEVGGGALAMVSIQEPELWRPLGILLKRNRSRSPALREFIHILQEKGRSLAEHGMLRTA
jgi:DNA-binding transcriptional LysR family regulator